MKIICLAFLWYGLSLKIAYGQLVLPDTHSKYRTTYRVLQQIAHTFDQVRPVPKLLIYPGSQSNRIARFNRYPEPEIEMDEKLYDLCRTFGKDSLNALSIIISHELTHYYSNHSSKKDLIMNKYLEKWADEEGLFHAFLAGFSPFELIRPLYSSLYEVYRLPAQSESYYPLPQRIQQVEARADFARKLGHLYTAGNFFFARQEYIYASKCWERVAVDLPFKELINNIGACRLLEAIQLLDTLEAPFRYPVEISTYNRLDPESVRGTPTKARSLLNLAVKNFSAATFYDSTYQTAYINMATAYSLLSNQEKAIETIDELQAMLKTSGSLAANAYLIRGIAYLQNGQEAMAKKDFEKMQGAYEYSYNYGLYRQYKAFFSTASRKQEFFNWQRQFVPVAATAKVAEKQMGRLSLPLPPYIIYQDTFNFPAPDLMRIKHARTPESDVFHVQLSNKQIEVLSSVSTAKMLTGKGLAAGDELAKIHSLYGAPQRIIPTGLGNRVYYYPDAHLLIDVRDKQVKNWMIFSQRK